MTVITKPYYVIYNENIVIKSGCSTGLHIVTRFTVAEFDTEAELLAYIETEHLISATEEEEYIDA